MSTQHSKTRFDILGIGTPVVDLLARTDDGFVSRHDMKKGAMALIDADTAEKLTGLLEEVTRESGGSVANSCAVASALGARVAFAGKVADDTLGEVFRHEIERQGVYFPTKPLVKGAPTARCIILVTPDGQRTMNTYLGAGSAFSLVDLDETVLGASAIVYLEGYLFDSPNAQAAYLEGARAARAFGRRVALTLSDAFCVDRHRAAFRGLIAQGVDILFANEAEICSLYEVNTFEEAAELASHDVGLAVLTRAEAGAVIRAGERSVHIAAVPVELVDSTGAGDAFAAGFLAALARGATLEQAGQLGARAASVTIARIGARAPEEELWALVR